MRNAALGTGTFTLPKKYRYEDATGGSYFGIFASQRLEHYTIYCCGPAAAKAEERQWAADQVTEWDDNTEALKMTFSSSQYDKVLEWLLACGANAWPEAPERLVADWKEQVAGMAELAG
jgi:hypothetical protein